MTKTGKIVLIVASAVYIALISTLVIYKNDIKADSQVVLSANSDKSLELVNKKRESENLKPLVWNNTLEKAAADKAEDIFSKNYFAHTSPDGTKAWNFILSEGYSYRYAGENLAVDFTNIDDAFNAWVASPSHLANIVSSKYSDYAMVEKEGVLNGEKTIIFVQLFATK